MADMQDIVRTVVAQVLAQLGAGGALPLVAVLAPRCEALEARVRPVADALFPGGADLAFLGEDFGGREPARHILPELSCTDMADLATGRAATPCARAVLDLLLQGRTVDVLSFAYEAHRSAPRALYGLYLGYEKTLATFGLRRLAPAKPGAARVAATLVSAAMVEQAAAEGAASLVVARGAIVTPLAADTARALHVTILKQG